MNVETTLFASFVRIMTEIDFQYNMSCRVTRALHNHQIGATRSREWKRFIIIRLYLHYHTTPSRKDVSKVFMTVLKKVISLRVLSKISLGSSDGQRRQFGAHTMAKLSSPIFDHWTLSGIINAWIIKKKSVLQFIGQPS